MEKLKNLKKGSFFTLKPIADPKESQVYIKGEYDRISKSFSCKRFDDSNNEKFVKTDRKVYTDFVF